MKQAQIHIAVVGVLALCAGSVFATDDYAVVIPPASAAVPNSASVVGGNVFESSGIPVSATRSTNPIRLTEGINLFADTGLHAGYDSNVVQGSQGNEVGSSFFRIRPTVTAQSRYRGDSYALSYMGDYIHYPSYHPNSLMQNDLIFGAQNTFTARNAMAWGASVGDHYDPIGSTDRSVGSSEADHYHTWSANGTYRFGAEEAKGRLEVDVGAGSKRYQNNRSSTESADVDNLNLGARFYYRVAPKTRLLTEFRRTNYDYLNDLNQLENVDSRYYLGATWDATAAFFGTVKVGQQVKSYKNEALHSNYSGLSWEASLRWRPLTYSSFDLLSGRSANDPSGSFSGVPIAKNLSLAWNHDWERYVHSKLSAARQRTNYNGTGRKDVEDSYSVGFMYDMRRWLGVGLEYTLIRRNSTVDTYDYLRRVSTLRLEASF
jgi:hypothetical protein